MAHQTRIGRTDLYVNPIGFGTNAVGGHNIYSNLEDEVGKDLVLTAIHNGIDFLDTAFIYGPKRSEELIGEVLKETGNRAEIVLATKGAHKFVGKDIVIDNSPTFLKQSVEDSLKRLQTDYIDLFYIHTPDKDTPKYEAVGAMQRLKEEGKIKAIGVSNFSMEQLKDANQDGYVDVYQGEYNLFKRAAENELFPYTTENNISFVPYFPLASGLLTGKFTKETVPTDRRSKNPLFQGEAYLTNLEKVEKLREIADAKQVELAHLVLAWYLTRDSIDVVIPGAKRTEQVLDNIRTLDVQLTDEEIQSIDAIFAP